METKDFYLKLTAEYDDEAPGGRAEIAALKGIEEALDDGFPVWFEGRGGEEHTLKIADFEISPVSFESQEITRLNVRIKAQEAELAYLRDYPKIRVATA